MPIDFDNLLKRRLVVARNGEMDRAGWWNTKGILGKQGSVVLQRGFPQTHYFAQARIAFSVAQARCETVFSAPGSVTLWSLPADIESQFEERWQHWLDEKEQWIPFFQQLVSLPSEDLLATLHGFELLSDAQVQAASALRRKAQGSAVQVSLEDGLDEDALALLAAGFARGERGKPAVPYAYLEDSTS